MTHATIKAGLAGLCISLLAACGADDDNIDNLPPTTNYTVDTDGDPLIRIDARGSSDEDGFVVAWTFDYGDGSPTEYSSSPAAIHTYAVNGSYTLTVSAIDDLGSKSSLSNTIVIARATGVAPPMSDAGMTDAGTTDAGTTDAGFEDGGSGSADTSTFIDSGVTPDNDAGTADALDGSTDTIDEDATTAIDAGPAPLPPEPTPTPDAG